VNINIGGYAGDSGQLMYIAKGLKKLGHEITFVTTDADIFSYDKDQSRQYNQIRKQLQEANEQMITIDEISVLPIHTTIPELGLYSPNASKIAKKIIPEYDVIHIFNWYYHLAIIFAKIAHQKKIPFIVSAAGGLQEKAKEIKKWRKQIVDKLFTYKMIQQSTILHSVGELETKSYKKLGANSKKIFRIDHGINIDDFIIENNTSINEKLDLKNKSFILFLSRINEKKGIELLLNAFKKIKENHDIFLVIAGTGEIKYVKEIKKLVIKLGLEHNVKFTGYVTDEEKLQLLDTCILYVLTSHSDVHPIAVQDALAVGAPVIITKECDYPEISEYEAGIEVDPTVKSISEGIEKLLSDKSMLESFSQNAKKLIREKFLIESKIKEYEEMYQKAIEFNLLENNKMHLSIKNYFEIFSYAKKNKKILKILSLKWHTYTEKWRKNWKEEYAPQCISINDAFSKLCLEKNITSETFSVLEHHIDDFIKTKKNEKYPSTNYPYSIDFGLDRSVCRLLFFLCKSIKPEIVVETGIANGFSSSYILLALSSLKNSKLISVDDLFLPWHTKEKIGAAIPNHLKNKQELIVGNAVTELKKLFKTITSIDIFIHDSLHTYKNMTDEFNLAWPHIKNGGFLISDDVSLNGAFLEFADKVRRTPIIILKEDENYFGLIQK